MRECPVRLRAGEAGNARGDDTRSEFGTAHRAGHARRRTRGHRATTTTTRTGDSGRGESRRCHRSTRNKEVVEVPVITVQMWEGQTVENKRVIARGITELLTPYFSNKPDAITIVFQEVPLESWARGGQLSVDRSDLGQPWRAIAAERLASLARRRS